jgi:cysteine-rich repeat protein
MVEINIVMALTRETLRHAIAPISFVGLLTFAMYFSVQDASPPPLTAQTLGNTQCSDNIDNDQDGLFDCNDTNCLTGPPDSNFLTERIFVAKENSPISGVITLPDAWNTRAHTVVDIDSDGDKDILITDPKANQSHTTKVLLNNGSEKFTLGTTITGVDNTGGANLSIGDINGDGDIDTITWQSTNFTYWENTYNQGNPNGVEQTVSLKLDPPIFTIQPSNIEIGDVDNDGDGDFIVGSRYGPVTGSPLYGTVDLYKNLGGNPINWDHQIIFRETNTQGSINSIAFGDFDGDQDLDVVASSVNGGFAWFINQGSTWSAPRTVSSSIASGPVSGDINGDGRIDIVASVSSAGGIQWFENRPGSPVSWVAHNVEEFSGSNTSIVHLSDVDKDGDLDIVTLEVNGQDLEWFENGGGNIPSWTRHQIDGVLDANARYESIFPADLNDDGKIDFLAYNNNTTSSWFEQTTTPTCDPLGDIEGFVCRDDSDNDGDSLTDEQDPGCHTDGDALNNGSYDQDANSELNTPRCGDGVKEPYEECDLGGGNSDSAPNTCRTDCKSPSCGDGVNDSGEQCDDGNSNNTDSCRNNCQTPRCGDGITDSGEQCDDGNGSPIDSCSVTCTFTFCGDGYTQPATEECDQASLNSNTIPNRCRSNCVSASCGDSVVDSGEECDTGSSRSNTTANACRLDCKNPRCGDGAVDSGEQCDDGNSNNADSCTNSCVSTFCGDGTVQDGEQCDTGSSLSDSTPDACRTDCSNSRCGDSVTDTGETCDDGNSNNADACSNTCTSALCGDGIRQANEACDNGAANSDSTPDACRTTCVLAGCPDGVKDTPEQCDRGSKNSDTEPDTCRTSCLDPFCGDSVKDFFEQCDDGNSDNDDICSNTCTIPVCGDGAQQGNEECDDGNRNSNTQSDACRLNCVKPLCGDGVTDTRSGEQCDDANTRPTDLCNLCRNAVCGDGAIQSSNNETCDDGNREDSDECTNNCTFATCGDGIVQNAEECDEGTANSNVTPGACRNNCALFFCGDRVIDSGEECDDGNTDSNDGCSVACRIESTSNSSSSSSSSSSSDTSLATSEGTQSIASSSVTIVATQSLASVASASSQLLQGAAPTIVQPPQESSESSQSEVIALVPDPEPTELVSEPEAIIASAAVCGDGMRTDDEECDEGTTRATSTCSSNCKAAVVTPERERVCGNGFFEPPEECDAGDLNSNARGATCRPGCISPKCGDGIKDPYEYCDDNNTTDGDGCSATCAIEVDDEPVSPPSVIAAEVTQFVPTPTQAPAPMVLAAQMQMPPPAQVPMPPSMQQQVNFPAQMQMQMQMPPMMQQLPLAQLQPLIAPQGVAGDTGPAAVAVVASGMAAGFGFMRKRRK